MQHGDPTPRMDSRRGCPCADYSVRILLLTFAAKSGVSFPLPHHREASVYGGHFSSWKRRGFGSKRGTDSPEERVYCIGLPRSARDPNALRNGPKGNASFRPLRPAKNKHRANAAAHSWANAKTPNPQRHPSIAPIIATSLTSPPPMLPRLISAINNNTPPHNAKPSRASPKRGRPRKALASRVQARPGRVSQSGITFHCRSTIAAIARRIIAGRLISARAVGPKWFAAATTSSPNRAAVRSTPHFGLGAAPSQN